MPCKNLTDLSENEEIETEKTTDMPPTSSRDIKVKKSINLSDEERAKRSERMKLLRSKLDNIGKAPKIQPKVLKKPPTSSRDIKVVKVEKENKEESQSENEEISDLDSEEEPETPRPKPKPIKKDKINNNHNRKLKKPMPRKVFKIKYYEEPSPAELLQDRLFLENQHKNDNDYNLNKNKKPHAVKNQDDISDKLFNY